MKDTNVVRKKRSPIAWLVSTTIIGATILPGVADPKLLAPSAMQALGVLNVAATPEGAGFLAKSIYAAALLVAAFVVYASARYLIDHGSQGVKAVLDLRHLRHGAHQLVAGCERLTLAKWMAFVVVAISLYTAWTSMTADPVLSAATATIALPAFLLAAAARRCETADTMADALEAAVGLLHPPGHVPYRFPARGNTRAAISVVPPVDYKDAA